ncbi:4-hydroxy-tetrahydrodipicolinate synthase [Jeotgalibaca porci]|uniref:4-hydroxy-tetrahydrodipicolinate synthase n=1 Tax=Jeotgalibaca porci TaxID=1868793 RepID=A0A6G7WH84_9LACT|nr:4-hydroxy-tetrahydrodipicolinate synthase [Jeotgalibaca porci]QIK51645.1 4-hydroxy-tetrahydrodipicolinate synthase [Jeotgalibaca porci]
MLKGSMVALVTPMDEENRINYPKVAELLEWHIENSTDGLVILGTTGEASTMTFEEEKEFVAFCNDKIAKRVPMIVGSGSNSTATAISNSQAFAELGADYLLVVTPYYNKTNNEGMIRHFESIADSVTVPIIMYNVPSRTGCNITPEVVGKLAKHPNIIGIKEASGDMSYVMNISKYINETFALYSGNDDVIVPLLSVGGTGVISVWANIMPKEVHDLVRLYLDGKTAESLAIQIKYLDLIAALFYEVNPIPVKAALNWMGWEVGSLRMPLGEMGAEAYQRLVLVLERFEEELR